MHATPPIFSSFREVTLAEDELGEAEPLVSALECYARAVAQLSTTAAIALLSVIVLVGGEPGALPVLLGAGVAAFGFGVRASLRAIERHDGVLELIVAGRGGVTVPIVRRELTRLLDPQRREHLARAYEAIGGPSDECGRVPHHVCVIAVPSVVVRARPDLLTVARLLRADRPPARGVAAAEQLLCGPGSSLFGRDAERLRQDLRRISFLLAPSVRPSL